MPWLYMTLLSVEALLLLRQYYLSNICRGITIRQVDEYPSRHYYLSLAALPSSPTLDHSLTSSRSPIWLLIMGGVSHWCVGCSRRTSRWSSRHAPTLVTVAVAVVAKHYYPSCQPCQSSDNISHVYPTYNTVANHYCTFVQLIVALSYPMIHLILLVDC